VSEEGMLRCFDLVGFLGSRGRREKERHAHAPAVPPEFV
jgi:hypothetical protein